MPISVIQFNGSNAYEFQPGEFITSREFGILNMDDLALGVEVYTANTTSRLKATMRFIDEHGVLLSTSSSTYTPTVQNLWERALFTWSVPEGATRAELRLEGLTSVILMAQPKVANGTDPGSYGSNWSPQLTFLTPTGIYTGTLSAKQIILSAGEDLSDRLVTINANQILMSSKLDNRTTKITNEGIYTGEIVADQVKTGLLKSTNGASEINMDNGSFSFGNGAFTFTPLNGTVMGGWKTTPTEMKKTVQMQYGPYTQSDKDRLLNILLGVTGPTENDLNRFDVNNDGRISNTDKVLIHRAIDGTDGAPNPWYETVELKFGGTDPLEVLAIGKSSIGMGQVKSPRVATKNIRGYDGGNVVFEQGIQFADNSANPQVLTASNGNLYWNGKKC